MWVGGSPFWASFFVKKSTNAKPRWVPSNFFGNRRVFTCPKVLREEEKEEEEKVAI